MNEGLGTTVVHYRQSRRERHRQIANDIVRQADLARKQVVQKQRHLAKRTSKSDGQWLALVFKDDPGKVSEGAQPGGWFWWCLTFELSRHQRCGAKPGLAKMYRVPPDRAWWPAVGAPLERGVRRRCLTQ